MHLVTRVKSSFLYHSCVGLIQKPINIYNIFFFQNINTQGFDFIINPVTILFNPVTK